MSLNLLLHSKRRHCWDSDTTALGHEMIAAGEAAIRLFIGYSCSSLKMQSIIFFKALGFFVKEVLKVFCPDVGQGDQT